MTIRDECTYYDTSLPEAAELFALRESELRAMIQRGALDARFASGQWWLHLGPRRGQEPRVRLWHGTSAERADWISDNGFQTVTQGREVWFTNKERYAREHAIGRARKRRSTPFSIACEIDLQTYPIYWKASAHIYVFCEPLGPETIHYIEKIDEEKESDWHRRAEKKKARTEHTDIEITQHAGPTGILFWMNTYLQQNNLDPVTLEDTAVQEATYWVQKEYAGGREGAIEEEELVRFVEGES